MRQKRQYTGVETLPSETIVHWDEHDPHDDKKVKIECGGCGKVRFAPPPHSLARWATWTGFCMKCAGLDRRNHGDVAHASGTVVHWDVRDPKDPHWYISITCHKCKRDSFVHKQSIRNKSWHGLCSDCFSKHGLPQKRYSLTGKYTNPFGAVIDYDAPYKTNYALVYCPNFATCGGKQQKVVTRGNQDKQPFFCRPCGTEFRRSQLTEAWQARSFNVVKKQSEKKRALELQSETEKQKERFEDIVRTLKTKMPASKISRQDILNEYHDRYESVSPTTITKRVQRFYGAKVTVENAVKRVI